MVVVASTHHRPSNSREDALVATATHRNIPAVATPSSWLPGYRPPPTLLPPGASRSPRRHGDVRLRTAPMTSCRATMEGRGRAWCGAGCFRGGAEGACPAPHHARPRPGPIHLERKHKGGPRQSESRQCCSEDRETQILIRASKYMLNGNPRNVGSYGARRNG